MSEQFRSGYIALVGRPNVGKSTLLNHLLGQKLSITSRKPQTTRYTLLGIKTTADTQYVFVDTPGLHENARTAMNRAMNRAASGVLADVDVIVFLIEALHWTREDELVLQRLAQARAPVVAAVSKVDKVKDKARLLPFLAELSQRADFAAVVPLSALRNTNLSALEEAVRAHLPSGGPHFGEDQITDRSTRFLAAEIIREKLMRKLGQEVPYDLAVEIESYREEGQLTRIDAVVWVSRPNQKAIVIGKGGERMKSVGQEAREDIEALIEGKVFLNLWVKVKEGWADDERALRSLGYSGDE